MGGRGQQHATHTCIYCKYESIYIVIYIIIIDMFMFIYIYPFIYRTLHYITLHRMALHCITLHYITLHYITLHYIHTTCMHACMHASIHIYMHACMHACMHAYIHRYIYTYFVLFTYLHFFTCLCNIRVHAPGSWSFLPWYGPLHTHTHTHTLVQIWNTFRWVGFHEYVQSWVEAKRLLSKYWGLKFHHEDQMQVQVVCQTTFSSIVE